MSETDLIERILSGTTLRTVMRPDPAIPSNRPEHVEGFVIEDIVINGDYFWASGPKNSLAMKIKTEPYVLCGAIFYYCNTLDVFASYAAPESAISLFPKRRYKEHTFLARDDHRVIWDSGGECDNARIREAIETGARLRIAMQDEQNIWNVHEVELPVYSVEDGTFQLVTKTGVYPACLRDPNFMQEVETRFDQVFPGESVDKIVVKTGMWPSYYMLFSNGQYHSTYGFSNQSRHASALKQYKRLKVFSDIF